MKTVLTGIRPTGPLHLGHYLGALCQWLPLQRDYQCFFLIADIQALTTHMDQPELIQKAIEDVVLDWLAVGLKPDLPNVHFVLQSAIPELHELTNLLAMVTPFTWMETNATVIAERARLGDKVSTGFVYYVVSQAADILFTSLDPAVSKAEILVPVGEDQVPHLRDTNKIAKAFNRQYGPTFNTCKPLVGEVGRLVGTDGNSKMSKSEGNVIELRATAEEVKAAVMGMFTDPKRISADVPGTVEGNPVFIYHDAFNSNLAEVAALKDRYEAGTVGDVEVKEKLIIALEDFLAPIRAKGLEYQASADIRAILADGTKHARELAIATLGRARDAMGLYSLEG
jgi:tryptophanyl-tRNA synthetase